MGRSARPPLGALPAGTFRCSLSSILVPDDSEIRGIKWLGKQIPHAKHLSLSLEIRQDYWHVAAEFPDELAASATGGRQCVGVSDHGDGVEAAFAFADGFEDGNALGADGESVRGVLYIAAAENSTGRSAHRCSHSKIRIWRMSVLSCPLRGRDQQVIFAHDFSFLRARLSRRYAIASAIRGSTAFSKAMNCPFTRSAVSSTST